MSRLNHVILLVGKKTVLGREKASELTRQHRVDNIPAMAKIMVCGCLIAKQTNSFPLKPGGRSNRQLFNAKTNHILNLFPLTGVCPEIGIFVREQGARIFS
jgi:hypothetical protein